MKTMLIPIIITWIIISIVMVTYYLVTKFKTQKEYRKDNRESYYILYFDNDMLGYIMMYLIFGPILLLGGCVHFLFSFIYFRKNIKIKNPDYRK